MAFIMLTGAMTVSISAKSDYNYIKVAEEYYVENGAFDDKNIDVYPQNLGQAYQLQTDGQWAYSINTNDDPDGACKISVKSGADGDNYLYVDATDCNPTVSYSSVKDIRAGEYTLTFRVKPDGDLGKLRLRTYFVTDNSKGDAKFDKEYTVPGGKWYTVSETVTIEEDTDFVFSFYFQIDGNFSIDNVSIDAPTNVLVETADMHKVSTLIYNKNSTPDGEWASGDLNRLTVTSDNAYVSAARNSSDKLIADTATIAYSFSEEAEKGNEYKLSLSITSNPAQKYYIQAFDALKGAPSDTNSFFKGEFTGTSSFDFSKEFTIPSDYSYASGYNYAKIAFRVYANKHPATHPYTIDNVKLEQASANNEYINKFTTAAEVNSTYSDLAVFSNGAVSGAEPMTWFRRSDFNVSWKQGYMHCEDPSPNGDGNGPNMGYNFGVLPAGNYTVAFDIKINSGGKLKDNTAFNLSPTAGSTGLASDKYSKNISTPSASGWRTVTLSFAVPEGNTENYFFRFWFNAHGSFDVDNLMITGPKVKGWSVIETDDFSKATNIKTEGCDSVAATEDSYWSYSTANGTNTVSHSAYDGRDALKLTTTAAGTFTHSVNGDLPKGDYKLSYRLNFGGLSGEQKITANVYYWRVQQFPNSPRIIEKLKKTGWKTVEQSFAVDNSNNGNVTFSFTPTGNAAQTTIYLSDYALARYEENSFYTLEYDNYSEGADKFYASVTDDYVSFLRDNPNTWVSRDLPAMAFLYDSDYERIKVVSSDKYIDDSGELKYGFGTTLTKGNYIVELEIKPNLESANTYKVYVSDRDGTIINTVTTPALTETDYTKISVPLTLTGETDVVLGIGSGNSKYCSPYTIKSADIYKVSNPISGIYSNGLVAQFDASTGTYHMVTGVENGAYINYYDFREYRPGKYVLSGEFRTGDPAGAELNIVFARLPLGTYLLEAGDEWQKIEIPVTIERDTRLSLSQGIKFSVDSEHALYFKNLTLNYDEDLPKPAVNSGIAMVLLKKMQGKMQPKIEEKTYNFVENSEFDEEANIAKTPVNYAWTKAVDGEWGLSINSSVKNAKGSLSCKEIKGEKALYLYAENVNPSVSYAVNGLLDEGEYTLSVDLLIEGSGQKGFSFDVFDTQSGTAVRTTEGAAIVTRSANAGKWTTVAVPFALSGNSDVVFRFWCNSYDSYYIDNVSITRAS